MTTWLNANMAGREFREVVAIIAKTYRYHKKSASINLEMLEPQFSITGNAFAIGDYEPTIPLITGNVGTTLITGTISTQLITGKLTNL